MILQPVLVVDRLAGADAQQDVVRLVIAVPQVMHVVGDDERHVQIAGDRQQAVVDDALLVDALELHLEEEVALAENVAIAAPRRPRAFFACSDRISVATSPFRQLLRPIRPSACCASSCLSMRGL